MSQGKTNPKSQYIEVKDQQQIRKLQALKEKPAIILDDRQTSKPILKNKSQKTTTNYQKKPQEKPRKPQNQDTRSNAKKQYRNQNDYKQKPQQRYEGERIHKQNIRKNYRNYYQKNYKQQIITPFYKCKDNEIFINDNNSEKYMQKVHQIIGKYDFINLVAYGNNIVTAISVSQQANKEIKKLYRINCPGTINAHKGVNKNEEKKVQILQPSLKIQLSLKLLPIRHMGYQDNLEVVNYNRKDRKKGYQAKEQQISNDKKKQKKYMEKKMMEYDEGELR